MRVDRRAILTGLSATAFSHCAGWARPQANWRKAAFADMSDRARKLVSCGQVAGIAAGLSTRGFRKSVYVGLADRDRGIPVGEDTRFRIASITKPIVAACVLQLEEDGQLQLTETIDRYFPTFPKSDRVTLYHLLTHTSGIGNWWDRMPDDAPADFMNSGTAHAWLAKMRPLYNFAPGTMREYSNSGYVLLGEIIEKASGRPLDEALKAYVLSRVGAGATFLERTPKVAKTLAVGYQVDDSKLVRAPVVPAPFAAGGIRGTLHDLLAFGDALFLGPLLERRNLARMVAHATVDNGEPVERAMYVAPGTRPERHPPEVTEMGYGLGINTWVQSGERFYSHAGLIDGFGAYFVHAPRSRTTAVLLANTFQGTASIHESVRQRMINAPVSTG